MSNTNNGKMKKYIWFIIGMVGVLLQMLPYVILGENTVVPYHDQLDGEMIVYILRAKYLFGGDLIPEFMGGMLKTSLTPPAPLFVLFFLTGNYFGAYIAMHFVAIIVGYVGMYLLSKEMGCTSFLAMVVAGVFAYLPFLPVYGLCEFGIPLLIWFYVRARRGRNVKGCLVYGVIYALGSSLVLVGFAVLMIIGVESIISLYTWRSTKIKEDKIEAFAGIGLFGVVCLTYILGNLGLVMQILGVGEYGNISSHKEEYVLEGRPFLTSVWESFAYHIQHCKDEHIYLFFAMLVVVPILAFLGKNVLPDRNWILPRKVFGWILFFAVVAGFWESNFGCSLRNQMGVLGSMSLSRVLWVSPTLWFWLTAIILGLLLVAMTRREGVARKVLGTCVGVIVACLLIIGILCIKNGTYAANLCRIIGREYSSISFGEYYANGVMEQVENYIKDTTGMEQEEYKVLSLGIDPGAAYYHGFYCLDGYSNNYSLEYKHKFREIIAPELAKSEYLTQYFDDWGNRCYLVYALIPGYYNFEKYTSYFWCFEMDVEAAKEMGAKYILSAVYLTNAEEIGLKLLREEPFETEDSYYAIYLYELE